MFSVCLPIEKDAIYLTGGRLPHHPIRWSKTIWQIRSSISVPNNQRDIPFAGWSFADKTLKSLPTLFVEEVSAVCLPQQSPTSTASIGVTRLASLQVCQVFLSLHLSRNRMKFGKKLVRDLRGSSQTGCVTSPLSLTYSSCQQVYGEFDGLDANLSSGYFLKRRVQRLLEDLVDIMQLRKRRR